MSPNFGLAIPKLKLGLRRKYLSDKLSVQRLGHNFGRRWYTICVCSCFFIEFITMLNIILDNDIVLELLSKSKNDTQHSFVRLQKSPARFWLPCCSLSSLETELDAASYHPLSTLLLKDKVQWLSSLAAHCHHIPPNCRNKTQALMSLDAATLQGTTIIWTNQDQFSSVHTDIEWGDHEFVYSMLAQEEDEISFFDSESQQLSQRTTLEKQFFNVLKHGKFIAGAEVERLENELALYVGTKHCISLASVGDALLIALMAVNIKAGDEVITSPFNSTTTVKMITLLGAKPVFVDIEPTTYTINPLLLKSAIGWKTKAIIVTNLFGQCADFYAINQIANQYDLPVIEEATQSFGATYHLLKSGSLSAIGCAGFSASQPLAALGEGGAAFTDDDQLAEQMRQLRGDGERQQNDSMMGIDSRLDTLQASLLIAQLNRFPNSLEKRRQIADNYNRLLEGSVKTPNIVSHNTSVYAQYTIEVSHRDQLQQQLQQRGIPTAVYYPQPLHLQYSFLNQAQKTFSVAETVAQRVLSLPIHPYLTTETQSLIINTLKSLL